MSSPVTEVQVLENVWIPVDAETRLSARIWLPKSSAAKFSVVLEYIPYRKSDWTSTRDASNHVWLAQRGFAVARVDIRGSGNSEGHYYGEYTPQELQDGVMVIEWLSSQSWCSGSVGVFGKSWGGFNGLQLAAMSPPALRGVVSLYSIDDRYADDVHYLGGAVLGSEALSWATVMFSLNALPMAPETVGSDVEWKRRYQERLEKQFPWLHEWLAHQTRDEFWEHGSICEAYDKVKCPVLEIGGWNDGYFNGVARMIKDEIENPTARILEYPGKWCAVDDVETLEQKIVTFYCSSEEGYKLQTTAEAPSTRERGIGLNSLQGAWSGEWLSFGGEDMPGNQVNEDAIATTWSTSPLNEDFEIVGRPQMSLLVKSNKPQALIMARLSDVSPSGKSTLVTRGVLNLSHRHGHKLEELSHMPIVNEDQGKDLLVDEGIAMEETAAKTYAIDPQCLHPRVSIQRTLTYEKLTPSEHSELLDTFADQVSAATYVDNLKLERVDYAEHPVLPWKVRVETDSSMASDATTFFLKDHTIVRLNDEIFFEKKWEKEIPRQFV
ncbi:hypothetical protein JG688_00008553 [Phytophthora aleatoria]|uniref:Xaa-Pro dipeptidyl-peptidase C-terminal domain-containing protein n=1 Tax=Phytophthora aleatoria TaxID=2496075 RepID=A0A8J5J7U0_9STRA|nr:hypothetical protein JG688_00008553 [Phytophthora aleatoria]